MDNMISVDKLTKKFGSTVVLKEISISFESGKIHGIIGRNGSGKTVFMKCICGLTPMTGGNVIVNIKDSRVAVNADMARHIMI